MYSEKYFNEVFTDIQKAKTWYKEQQEGLEERFAEAVTNCIHKILKMPTSYSIRYKNVRIAHTDIFPYNIHFYIDETFETVVIIGVVYNRRQDSLALKRV